MSNLFGRCYKNPDFEPFFKHELERQKKERPNIEPFNLEFLVRSLYKVYKMRVELIGDGYGAAIPSEEDYLFAFYRLRHPEITNENVKALAENEIKTHNSLSSTGCFNNYTINYV